MVDKNKVDKAYEGKSAKEMVLAPAEALQGVSEGDGEKLLKSFNIVTIKDMAECEWFNKALAIKRKVEGR